MKRNYHLVSLFLLICFTAFLLQACASRTGLYKCLKFAESSPENIVSSLTLEQRIAQMLMPAVYHLEEGMMKENCYGAVLSKKDTLTASEWKALSDSLQKEAVLSDAGIPLLYGQDDVHGVNYCKGAVIFPHNIGLGAADDPALTKEAARLTALQARACGLLWNYAPESGVSVDPRWGRTYECFGEDPELVTRLSRACTEGFVENGLIACAKHYLADGNTLFGTGEQYYKGRPIDRGDAILSEEEIDELLAVYKAQIDAGVQTIMISDSTVNGVRMCENRELLDRLKKDLGFDGFLLTDWNAIKTASGNSYEEKLIKTVNAGADMLMEVDNFDEVGRILKEAVRSGKIPEERINDAAARIIRVKQRAGLFSDPFKEADDFEKLQQDLDQKSRDTACMLVEKSLVLLKNENRLLPIRPGTKIYVAGPAADNAGVQGGGWTVEWQGVRNTSVPGFTTLLEGLRLCEDRYGLTIITDPEKAAEADVVLLALGEVPYAEYQGDSYDPDLLGKHGLSGNQEAMQEAQALKKPVITCIMAGRQVFIADYMDQWDSVVMCYLPGSEGQGIARVLLGETDFTGKLPSPWYASVKDLEAGKPWLKTGYGLSMK